VQVLAPAPATGQVDSFVIGFGIWGWCEWAPTDVGSTQDAVCYHPLRNGLWKVEDAVPGDPVGTIGLNK
jgi:hypothetical protein